MMLVDHLRKRGIENERVLEAMRKVPRDQFVPEEIRVSAYEDTPLPIGYGQTISQPYMVALMTELADPQPTDRALDVGTGSGYQAALLAELVHEVYSLEIIKPLAEAARSRLKGLKYCNVEIRCGDGYQGWPEHAPFDIIIAAAAPQSVPTALVDQLAVGGRLIIPVGARSQQTLWIIEKRLDGTLVRRSVTPVAFVPMTGEAETHQVENED